jgi:hypothetical protein
MESLKPCGEVLISFDEFWKKGAYELVDYDGIPLSEPRNGLYLKKYYAQNHLYTSTCIFIVSYFLCVTIAFFSCYLVSTLM